ncbi:MAG: DUF4358 domain-containing protein [Clostridia bacterium]|nr:DUF4358 domain-containing protein [Clostridia bacterium]
MKRFFALFLAVIAFAGIVSCSKPSDEGSDNANITIDIANAGQKLLDGTDYQYKPEVLPADAVSYFAGEQFKIDLNKVETKNGAPEMFVAISVSSPETVVIIAAKDAASAKAISEGAIKDWLKVNIDGYSDYGPEQVPKLESAINTVKGRYVFYVVSADNGTAKTVVDEIVKNASK